MSKNRLKIAVYAIAKDETAFVARFMKSCSGSDIVVVGVDPGDETGKLLKLYGAIVHEITLPRFRFDHYRNKVLDLIPRDIDVCVSLDLDEVLPEDWRLKIESAWKPGTTRLEYYLQWSPDSKFKYDRIHARSNYEWRHANHEAVYPIYEKLEVRARSDLTITHFPDTKKDRSKNISLLEFAVEEDPTSTRMLWYLAREYYYLGEWKKAIKTFFRYFKTNPFWNAEKSWASIIIARCYESLGNTVSADAWLLAAIGHCEGFRDPLYEYSLFLKRSLRYRESAIYFAKVLEIKTDQFRFFETNRAFSNDVFKEYAEVLSVVGMNEEAEKIKKRYEYLSVRQ